MERTVATISEHIILKVCGRGGAIIESGTRSLPLLQIYVLRYNRSLIATVFLSPQSQLRV